MPTQYCTIHKGVETLRICGRCERPFCPDCLIPTPVGGRCRECARGPKISRLRIEPWRWPLIALTAAIGGMAGGMVFGLASWFFIVIAWFTGQLIAGAVLPVSGRKPGLALAVVTVVFLGVGVLSSGAIEGLFVALRDAPDYGSAGAAVQAAFVGGLLTPWNWVGAVIMAVSAYTRLR